MCTAIIHHGPGDSRLYNDGALGFGFRRLSILDLSPAGHQPMISENGALAMVCNGVIYNYTELRQNLIAPDHTFQSSGDCEVLLHAYQEWGADCLNRLNGMWAFLIYDRRRRKVFGTRDGFGVKPLSIHCTGQAAVFGSEFKTLQPSGLVPTTATNWQVAKRNLTVGDLDNYNATFFEGIEKIPPGAAFELGLDGSFRQ